MKYSLAFIFLALLTLGTSACKDDEVEEALRNNYLNAVINGESWKADEINTQRSVGENGPLILTGKGGVYQIEIEMRGITTEGDYPMGITRVGRVMVGNTEYSTLDVKEPGMITITRFEEHLVEGEFQFTAHWHSANNAMRLTGGKFKAFIR